MASKDKAPDAPSVTDDDWFDGEEVVSSDLPRYGIADPNERDPDSDTPVERILLTVKGWYEDTSVEYHKDKMRQIHRLKLPVPMNGRERIEIWGNAAIDKVLPTLKPGAKIQLTYVGKIKVRGRKVPMKDIRVDYPATWPRRPHPYPKVSTEE